MSSGRERILGGIRRSLGRDAVDAERRAALEDRLAHPKRNLVPARAQIPHAEQVELFVRQTAALSITVSRVDGLRDVPGAVADFLAHNNLPTTIRMSPDPAMDEIPWTERPLLEIKRGRAEITDAVGVTPAFAGIAETATLMMVSGPNRPATINFVPDTHIVVLKAKDILGSYEDALAKLRQGDGGHYMPRTVNLVTGPSRTADIALTMILGAHGPRNLHIVLVDGEDA